MENNSNNNTNATQNYNQSMQYRPKPFLLTTGGIVLTAILLSAVSAILFGIASARYDDGKTYDTLHQAGKLIFIITLSLVGVFILFYIFIIVAAMATI